VIRRLLWALCVLFLGIVLGLVGCAMAADRRRRETLTHPILTPEQRAAARAAWLRAGVLAKEPSPSAHLGGATAAILTNSNAVWGTSPW
jgi:hypothetical protein